MLLPPAPFSYHFPSVVSRYSQQGAGTQSWDPSRHLWQHFPPGQGMLSLGIISTCLQVPRLTRLDKDLSPTYDLGQAPTFRRTVVPLSETPNCPGGGHPQHSPVSHLILSLPSSQKRLVLVLAHDPVSTQGWERAAPCSLRCEVLGLNPQNSQSCPSPTPHERTPC